MLGIECDPVGHTGCRSRGTEPRALACSLVLLAIVIALAVPRGSTAAIWPASPAGSVPVCSASGTQQSPAAIPDHTGGAYVTWVDQRSGAGIYVQRLTRLGDVWPGWPSDGVLICATATIAPTPGMVSDQAGGVIVAWQDSRAGGDVYAQRVDPTGVPQWTADGVAVCTASGAQYQPRVATDGSGGVVLTWEDSRGATRDVYAQRLSGAGVPQWAADGVAVGSGVGDQSAPDIVLGTSGSTLIAWTDGRSGNNDIYVQRLTSAGAAAWTANGVLMVANAMHQDTPRLAPDGSGGAYVVFQDQRNIGITGVDLYAQRVGSAGAVLWGAMGVPVCTMGLDQQWPVVVAIPSGVVIVWDDYRSGTLPVTRDIFSQKLYSNGTAAWTTDGIDLASVSGDQFAAAIVSDGKQGVVVAWTDTRNDPAGDIYGARVDSSGIRAPGWVDDGTPMNATAADQQTAALATDGTGGAIVIFRELVSGSGYDIRAQRIGRHGRPEVEAVALIPDGSGGSFVAWEDYGGSDADARVQRFTESGAVAAGWPAGGILVTSASGNQQHTRLCEDGAGGAFVVWEDDRDGLSNRDIYVQRVSGMGTIESGWPADGVDVIEPMFVFDDRRPQVVPDGSGGAFVGWVQGGLPVGALYVQRVDASGALQLASPAGVALVAGYDAFSIAADGAGGLLLGYESFSLPRSATVMRIDADGMPTWGPIVPSPDGMPQHEPSVVADGAGGAYIAWRGETGGPPTPSQIMAQHLDATGAVRLGWPAGGLAVAFAAGNQYDLALTADGLGGALLAWTDERTAGIPDLYAQRATPAGAVSWTAGGLAVSTAMADQTAPVVVADGGGGALVAWQDRRSGTTDIYAQRVTAAGAVAARWTAGGVLVAQLPATFANGDQHGLAIASDGASGAQLAWYDTRGGFDIPDVRMLHIDAFAIAGVHGLAILRVRDVPQDEGGRVQLMWSPHALDRAPGFDIEEYWIWRQIPETAALAALAAERGVLEEADLAAGRPRRGQILRAENHDGYYWEFLQAQPASGFPTGYSYVAATTSDSISPASPCTHFMIQARHRTVLAFWSSAPDSGRSVDNIAPGAPGAFVVQYFTGGGLVLGDGNRSAGAASEAATASFAWLHWVPNGESDFHEYRVHRGASSDFEPGPGNLIATLRDTGYVDAGAPPSFYKLLAVDAHGNVSGAAAAAPANLLDAPGGAGRAALRLAPARPNPAPGRTTIGFALPRATEVEIEVFDAAGRLVRSLVRGSMTAGEHSVTWDGADPAGRAAPDGIYFVRMCAAGSRLTSRVTLMRR